MGDPDGTGAGELRVTIERFDGRVKTVLGWDDETGGYIVTSLEDTGRNEVMTIGRDFANGATTGAVLVYQGDDGPHTLYGSPIRVGMVAWALRLGERPYTLRALTADEVKREYDAQVGATLGGGI